MNYKNDKSDAVYNLIVDFAYLKSFEKDLVGIFLFPYFDLDNNFDIISFYDKKEVRIHIEGNSQIGENRVQYVNLEKSTIPAFKNDIINGIILFDKTGELSNLKKDDNERDRVSPTNLLELNYDKLSSLLEEKFNDTSEDNYLNIYYTLVDFYYNLIIASKESDIDFDVIGIGIEMHTLLEERLVFKDNKKLHESAILEAIKLANENTLSENKQKKMVKNDNI